MIQLALPATLASDLQQVDQIVRERVRAQAAVLRAAGARLGQPGDLRLRAALVLLSAATGAYQSERVLHAAAAVELIRAATATHDGLVDESERRRGLLESGAWNHGVALMAGDYLFALAAGEMALSPDPRVITYYSQAVMQISEATLITVARLEPLAEAREHYFARASGIAAALYAAACRAGGACGGLEVDQIEGLGRYGQSLGLALALGAELADFGVATGNGAEPPGSSLRRGAVTLPLIYAAASGDAARLAAALDGANEAELAWALAEVRTHGLAAVRAEVARLAAEATAALAPLAPGAARAALADIATQVA